MKNNKMRLVLAGLFLCAAMPVLAQEKSRDEKNLDKAAMELEKDAAMPEGEARVADRLKSEFSVDDARVQGLRDRKLGYGEAGIVLSLARQMPGGITDANVEKVMALRQGPPVTGWGKVARELGFKLGPTVSKVKKISAETRKRASAEKAERNGKNAEKGDKAGRPERMEKMERPEKGGRPETHGRH